MLVANIAFASEQTFLRNCYMIRTPMLRIRQWDDLELKPRLQDELNYVC